METFSIRGLGKPASATWQYQTNRYTGQIRPRRSAVEPPPGVTRLSTNTVSAKP